MVLKRRCKEKRTTPALSLQNHCKIGLEELWWSCKVHLSSPTENGNCLHSSCWTRFFSCPRKLSSGGGNAFVSYLLSLGSATNLLPHFSFSKSTAHGNHLCIFENENAIMPSPGRMLLISSCHILSHIFMVPSWPLFKQMIVKGKFYRWDR